jgi:hypothetical protein
VFIGFGKRSTVSPEKTASDTEYYQKGRRHQKHQSDQHARHHGRARRFDAARTTRRRLKYEAHRIDH